MTSPEICTAIIGAGLCGLATAIQLRRAGHHVVVFEKDTAPNEIGAGINMFHNAINVFRAWGLYSKLEIYGTMYDYASIMSYDDGSEIAKLDKSFRYREIMIHRADLLQILLNEAEAHDVTIRYGVEITDISSPSAGRPVLRLSSGETLEWDLVLGADGERSNTRSYITGQTISQHDSGNDVFRMTLPLEQVLRDEELKSIFEPSRKNFWLGPGGNALTYALKRGNLLNVVTTQEHEPGSVPLWQPSPKPIAKVLDRYHGWDPRLRRLLSLGSICLQWTLLQSELVPKWTNLKQDMALIGDAAHPMPPYIGQGAAMGFEDAAVLGTLFASAISVKDIPAVLNIYETIRKPRLAKVRQRTLEQLPIYNLKPDSERRKRDDKFRAGPLQDHPFFLLDRSLHAWLFEFDVCEEARTAWKEYRQQTENPNTLGPTLV